jgi:hypothetical protein
MQKNFCLAEELSASQEGLCSVKLFTCIYLFSSSSELFLINVNVAEGSVDDNVRMETCLLSPRWWDGASRKFDKSFLLMEAPNLG